MKKNDLFKVIGITFLIVVLLSFVIPAGVYSSGTFTSLKQTLPIGLYDIFRTPFITIATFIQYGLLFLVIGGFYGILNKTKVYSKLVDVIVKKWSKNKKVFLFMTIAVFALLTSLTGMLNLVFILVPLFVAVLLKLGYNKITSFASTVGAMLIGQVGSTLGFNIWGYLMMAFDLKMTTIIAARIILFLVVTILFMLLINKKDKNIKNKEEVIPLYEESSSKKSYVPLIIMGIITFVLLFVGLYDWTSAFNIDLFTKLDETIMSYTIGDYPIFSNLLGTVSPFGSFNNYDLTTILVISSLIIGWIYSVSFKEMLNGFIDGAKQMLKPALYAMLSCVVFTAIMNMQSGNFIATMINELAGSEYSFSGTVLSSLVASFAYNDFYYVLANFYTVFASYDASLLTIVAIIFQTMYGIIMLLAPTSLFLIAGLSYMEIPYKDWAKYIWKFLLIILAVVICFIFILKILI